MDRGAMAGFKRIRQDCATKRQQQNTCVSITRKEIKVMNNVGDFNKILNQRKNKLIKSFIYFLASLLRKE